MKNEKITKEQVENIAQLARLKLSGREVGKMQKELASILDFINQLDEVDVSLVKDVALNLTSTNVMREDKAIPERPEVIDTMLEQVPNRAGEYVKTKPIL